MRLMCKYCSSILDDTIEFGAVTCSCGSIYFIKNHTTGDIECRSNNINDVVFLDNDETDYVVEEIDLEDFGLDAHVEITEEDD